MEQIAFRLWRHRLLQPAALVITGLLMAFSLWQQLQQWQALLVWRPPVATTSEVPKRPAIELERLAGLLGDPAVKPKELPRKTTLPLTLLGSFVSARPEHSAAVIQIAGKTPKRVTVGQEVTSGVRLEAVLAEHVVLTRSGAPEYLLFPRSMALQSRDKPRTYPAFSAVQLQRLPAMPPTAIVAQKVQGLRQELSRPIGAK